ncbi:MAG: homocysteine S-methyltransferase family protein, partial [Alistipes sp.]
MAQPNIQKELERRILLLDGGFGTMVQPYKFSEEAYRGERFASSAHLLKGCNDLLCLTQPDVVREIHAKYLQAGSDVVTTNSFNANALSLADYGLSDEAYEISRAAASLARAAADEFTARNPQKPRFVGGSVGPTSHTLSMSADVDSPAARNVSFEQMSDAYREQVRGLIDGGADLLMLETCFDTLNVKAAIFAVEELFAEGCRRLPIVISGTLTPSGRTLSGQEVEAFYASVAHAAPLAVSLNCSFGAKALLPYLERLSAVA